MSWFRGLVIVFLMFVALDKAPRADAWIVCLSVAAVLALIEIGEAIRAHAKSSSGAGMQGVA